MKLRTTAAAIFIGMLAAMPAKADKLDDIIASGTLRCAVTLDFPPMGSRDENNQPIGFDVDTCNDLAKALGVKAEIVETPFPDRIPALVSDRADVGVASTSDTLERAKTIGFSIPYFAFKMVVLTKDGTGIDTYESLKGKKTRLDLRHLRGDRPREGRESVGSAAPSVRTRPRLTCSSHSARARSTPPSLPPPWPRPPSSPATSRASW